MKFCTVAVNSRLKTVRSFVTPFQFLMILNSKIIAPDIPVKFSKEAEATLILSKDEENIYLINSATRM